MSSLNCGCARCAHEREFIPTAGELNEWSTLAESEELWEARRRARPKPSPRPRPRPRRVPPDFSGSATVSEPAAEGCDAPLTLDGFEPGSYRLLPHHLNALRELTVRLRDNPPSQSAVLLIRGHTDSNGDRGANYGLGFARALEVRAFMEGSLATVNVPRRIAPGSAGADEPVASNSTEIGRRRNRRVELRVCTRSAGGSTPQPSATSAEPASPPTRAEPPPYVPIPLPTLRLPWQVRARPPLRRPPIRPRVTRRRR